MNNIGGAVVPTSRDPAEVGPLESRDTMESNQQDLQRIATLARTLVTADRAIDEYHEQAAYCTELRRDEAEGYRYTDGPIANLADERKLLGFMRGSLQDFERGRQELLALVRRKLPALYPDLVRLANDKNWWHEQATDWPEVVRELRTVEAQADVLLATDKTPVSAEADNPAGDEPPSATPELKRLAAMYRAATEADLSLKTDRQVWQYIQEAAAADAERADLPPSFEAWQKQIGRARAAGLLEYRRRPRHKGRATGKSVIRADQK